MSREVLVNINGKEEMIGVGAKAYRSIGTNEVFLRVEQFNQSFMLKFILVIYFSTLISIHFY